MGSGSRPPAFATTPAAEIALDHIPELLGEIERLRAVPWAPSRDILPPVSAHTDLHHVHRALPDEVELPCTHSVGSSARERSVVRVFARLHVRPRPKGEALYRILLPGVLSLKGPS